MSLVVAVALVAAGATASPAAAGRVRNPCHNGYVSISFDDSPTAMTPKLLRELRRAGMRATFFDVGERAVALPQYVRDQAAAGHQIANHSYDHPDLTLLSETGVHAQLATTQSVLTPLAGYAPAFMRPPFGALNDTVRTVAGALGLTPVIWTVDTVDWSGVSSAQIVREASKVQPGGFVLMHDGYANTIAAVPKIASGLAARGLCAGRIVASDTPTVAWEGMSFPATVTAW